MNDELGQLEFLIESNIKNLIIFQNNYGNCRINDLGKVNLKNHIKNTTNYIKTILKAKCLKNVELKVKKIKDLRNLCLNIDYDIFDDLIDVITCKSKDDKSIKTNVKKNNNRKKEEDIIMEDESRNQSKKEQKYQTSIQIDKQLVKQKISEEYTNDMLGRALSKAEYLSSRFGKKQIEHHFNYYNRFDNGFTKDKEDLKKSLINALDTLQDYYEMDGPKKRYPKNFDQKKIIKYIKQLKESCSEEDEGIFDDFINIILGAHVNFDQYFNHDCKVDPHVLATNGVSSMKFAAKQEKEWKNKALKNGDYDVNLNMDQNWNNNTNIPKKFEKKDYENYQ